MREAEERSPALFMELKEEVAEEEQVSMQPAANRRRGVQVVK
jgi:hypothetical protein